MRSSMGWSPASSLPQKLLATTRQKISLNHCDTKLSRLQDMETVGPSATVPGIVVDSEPRPAFAHKQFESQKRRRQCSDEKTKAAETTKSDKDQM